MHAHASRYGDSYRCRQASRAGRICPTGGLTQWAVDAACDEALAREFGDPERIVALLEAAREPTLDDAPEAAAKRISHLRRERERAVQAFERGWRGLSETDTKVRSLDREIVRLERISRAERVEPALADLATELGLVFAAWESLTPRAKRAALAPTVRAIHVERAGRAAARVVGVELALPGLHPDRPTSRNAARTGWIRIPSE